MNIDEGLAQRVRETLLELADFADISERKMFGALMTMVNGHMTCGISGAKPGSKIRPRARVAIRTGRDPGFRTRTARGSQSLRRSPAGPPLPTNGLQRQDHDRFCLHRFAGAARRRGLTALAGIESELRLGPATEIATQTLGQICLIEFGLSARACKLQF